MILELLLIAIKGFNLGGVEPYPLQICNASRGLIKDTIVYKYLRRAEERKYISTRCLYLNGTVKPHHRYIRLTQRGADYLTIREGKREIARDMHIYGKDKMKGQSIIRWRILEAVYLHNEKDVYPYGLLLAEDGFRKASVYTVLHRFEDMGYLTSDLVKQGNGRGRRARVYEITEAGKSALKDVKECMETDILFSEKG